nr:E3 ubiquitin protein ligase HECTD1 [Hymenolepis microstoma]
MTMALDQAKELLQVEDADVRFECLSNICFELSTNSENRRYSFDEAFDVLKLMFDIFSKENMSDMLLELTSRSLIYLIELCDPIVLAKINTNQYRDICNHLAIVDLSTTSGRELAECLVKLLETIAQFNGKKLYQAGAPTIVLRFLVKYLGLQNPFRDVINSTRTIADRLFRISEPFDSNVEDWMSVLNELYSSDSIEVVKWTLQILGTILNRFLQTGQDLSVLPTGGLDQKLSHNLFIICKKIYESPISGKSLFYNPSLFELAAASRSVLNKSAPRFDESDISNIIKLLKVLVGLAFCSKDMIEKILREENKIAFCIVIILRHVHEEAVLALTFELLQVLILRSTELNTIGESVFSTYLHSFLSFKKAIVAVKSNDTDALKDLLSMGLELDHVDNQCQSILAWAAAFSNVEIVEKLINLSPNSNLEFALATAAAFGRKSICEVLLEAGANPYIPVKDGMNTLQLLEKFGSPCDEIVDLINSSVQSPIAAENVKLGTYRLLPIYKEEVIYSKEGNSFIIASEIFFELVDMFEKTLSETIKYKSFLFILRLVRGLNSRCVEAISENRGDFRVCHMIRLALSQESIKIVRLALQLCDELVKKAGSIYCPLLEKHGIIALIKTVNSVMELPNFYSKLPDNTSDRYQTQEDSMSVYSDANYVNSDEEYNVNDEDDDYDEDNDRGDDHNDDNDHESNSGSPKPENETEKEVVGNQVSNLPDPPPLVYQRPSDIDVVPLGSSRLETWHEWSVVVFGGILFIFSQRAAVMILIEGGNKSVFKAAYCTSEDKNVYLTEDRVIVPLESGEELWEKVVYLVRKFKEFRFEQTGDLFLNWPYFNTNGHMLVERRRSRSQERRQLSSLKNGPRRYSSAPATRTFEPQGEDFMSTTTVHYAMSEEGNYPVAIKVGDILLDLVETPSGTPFMRVCPDHKDPGHAMLFSACFQQGFYLLNLNGGVVYSDSGLIPVRMDGRNWVVQHLSGVLQKDFSQKLNIHRTGLQEGSRAIHLDVLNLASKLASIDDRIPQPAPPVQTQKEVESSRPLTDTLFDIKCQMRSAIKSSSKERALTVLAEAFTRLKDICSPDKEPITHYEIASSNLVSAILLCLSSKKLLGWRNLVQSNNAEDHLAFLEARRNVFRGIFGGTENLQILVMCILDSLDQTECLPLFIFEQLPHPSTSYELTDQLKSGANRVKIRNYPKSAPPNKNNSMTHFNFTDDMTENSPKLATQTIPLGIISPPLTYSTDFHNYLTGGGIRGVIDNRLFTLLGSWFLFYSDQCTDGVTRHQIDKVFTLKMKPHQNSCCEILVDKELFILSRGYRRSNGFSFLDNMGQIAQSNSVLQKWDTRPRNSLPFLYNLMRGKKDERSIRRLPRPLKLTTGLVRWLGTCGGKTEWRNPCTQRIVLSCIFAAFCDNITSDPENAAFELESSSPKQTKKIDDFSCNEDILDGYMVGTRWTFESGVHIIPSAFQVNSIRRGGINGPLIKHWCLQGSESARRWVTLYVSETALKGDKPVIFPLNPENYKIWSGPLSGSPYTTAHARKLSHGEENLVRADVCTQGEEVTDFEPPSFRVFRIMDLTSFGKVKKIFVSGFDLFGTVKYVHQNLLDSYRIAGSPSGKFAKKRPTRKTTHSRGSCGGDEVPSGQPVVQSDDDSEVVFYGQDLAMFDTPDQNGGSFHGSHSVESTPFESPMTPGSPESEKFFDVETVEECRTGNKSSASDGLISGNSMALTSPESLPLRNLINNFELVETQTETERNERESINASTTEVTVAEQNQNQNASDVITHTVITDSVRSEPTEVSETVEVIPVASLYDDNKVEEPEAEAEVVVEQNFADNPESEVIPVGKLAEIYMADQVQRILEGRELNRLSVPEETVPKHAIAPSLVEQYHPQMHSSESALALFTPRITPEVTVNEFESFLEKPPSYELEYELLARQKDGTVVSSLLIDDNTVPIFHYILRLAEEVLYSSESDEELAMDDFPQTSLTLEFRIRDPSIKHQSTKSSSRPILKTGSFLSSRDIRLVNFQSKLLVNLGVFTSSGDIPKRTENLLEVVSLFSKIFPRGSEKFDLKSFRLNQKLDRQLKDVLAVSSGGLLPDWCLTLTQSITPLFDYNARMNLFRTCAFGLARSLLWLKELLSGGPKSDDDTNNDDSASSVELGYASRLTSVVARQLSGQGSAHQQDSIEQQQDSYAEYELDDETFKFHRGDCNCRRGTDIGRLFKNYAFVPRDSEGKGSFYAWAERIMDEHAECKSELEVRFQGEDGTGSGPTLEFYNLISLEFRRESLGMWVPSYRLGEFVHHENGLFPAPYPKNAVPFEVIRRFYIMGITVGKALQDRHLLDLPLSKPFLQLLANYASSVQKLESTFDSSGSLETILKCATSFEQSREKVLLPEDAMLIGSNSYVSGRHWLTGVLDFEDFAEIYPDKATFFRQWMQQPDDLTNAYLESLCLTMSYQLVNGREITLQDVYPWESSLDVNEELPPSDLTLGNYKDYIRRTLEFCLDKGIRAQMDAFRVGLERVLSMRWLSVFTSSELGDLIRGSVDVSWGRQELLDYTEPVNNYSRDSPGYLLLIDVLAKMDADDRRSFLRFVTGTSCLPVGGLRNLQPRLKVARKSPEEGPFPSVNTCAHYLKMPEFTDAQDLYRSLKISMSQTGFHLN